MKISVIIPIYNAGATIEDMLICLINQTYSNFEVIMINDGSEDSTEEICLNYVKKDDRFSYFYKTNSGVSSTRNYGLEKITGDLVSFLDADDKVPSNYFQTLVNAMTESIDLVVSGYQAGSNTIELKNQILNTEEAIIQLPNPEGALGYLWNKLFRVDIIKNNNLRLDATIHIGEDLLFCLEYILYSEKIRYISDVLYEYIVREDSATNRLSTSKGLTQVLAFQKCITLLKEYKINKEIIAYYVTIAIRITTGHLFLRMPFVDKKSAATIRVILSAYKINDASNTFVKLKFFVAKVYLQLHKLVVN